MPAATWWMPWRWASSSPRRPPRASPTRSAPRTAAPASPCLYGNYAGDNMNVKMATRMVGQGGHRGCDRRRQRRRLLRSARGAGEAPRRRGRNLHVEDRRRQGRLGRQPRPRCRPRRRRRSTPAARSASASVPARCPAVGHPNFQIEPGTMEVGIGHHGEPGARVEPLKTADEVADDMLQDRPGRPRPAVRDRGRRARLGPRRDPGQRALHPLRPRSRQRSAGAGLRVHRAFVGNYFTSLEMVGATLTVMALDTELKALLDVERRADRPALYGGSTMHAAFTNADQARRPSWTGAADRVIVANKAYLSEIDGKIGDGDHGVNMAKGFGRAAERIKGSDDAARCRDAGTSRGADDRDRRLDGSALRLHVRATWPTAIQASTGIDARRASAAMLHAGLEGVRRRSAAAEVGRQDADRCAGPGSRGFRRGRDDHGFAAGAGGNGGSGGEAGATARSTSWQRSAAPAGSANARAGCSTPAPRPAA